LGTALAVLAIFAIMAVLMYLNRLPAIVALPIMAIAIALAARVPWTDLATIISDGTFLLHKAYATAILGSILAAVVSQTGVAETLVKKAAELGGDRPIALALVLTAVVAVLFTTLGGLGAVIMVATIVFPVLLAVGLPQLAVGCLFLLGMSLGGIFNLTNWQLYKETMGLSVGTILTFAVPLAALLAAATVVFAVVQLRPGRLRRYCQDPEPVRAVTFVPWYSLLTPVVPLLLVLGFAAHNLLRKLLGAQALGFEFPIVTAMVIGIAYGLVTASRPPQGRVQLLAKAVVDGIGGVAPAVALMLGIGILVKAVMHPQVLEEVRPLLGEILPSTRVGYVVVFTVLAPLTLYRGPLNVWGMGFGLAKMMAAAPGLGPAAIMAALLSVGQIQGVCDPTNTHNVWVANYVGVDVQRILRSTITYVWAAAALGLVVAAVLFM
jgi:H+/gluconate symporter-like permease